jgi:hypothetical protein
LKKLNVSGPGYFTFNPDGSFMERLEGNSVVFVPGQLILSSGRIDVEQLPNANPVIVRTSGNQRDLCAMLG